MTTPKREGYVAANGLNIYYQEMGSGHPLILLHGGTATSISWGGYMPELAKHFRVIAPDTRAHGKTANPGGTLTYSLLADDVAAFAKALELEKPFVCGYSDGGQIVLEIGMRHPDMAQALIAGGTVPRYNEEYYENLRSWGFNGAGDVDMAKVEEVMAPVLDDWRVEHAPLGGAEYWKTLIQEISTLWCTPIEYTDADFQKITPPTLVLAGDRDDGLPVELSAELYRLLPKGELAIIANGTHETTISTPTGISPFFLNAVSDFLLRHQSEDNAE